MEPTVSDILSPLRGELESSEQYRPDGAREIVIKDPVNGNIYGFPPKAFALLSAIRPGQTIGELIGTGTDAASVKRRQQVEQLVLKARRLGLFADAPPAPKVAPPPRHRVLAYLTNPVWHLFEIPLRRVEPVGAAIAGLFYGRGALLPLALFAAALLCIATNHRAYLGSIQIFSGFIWWWWVAPLAFLSSVWHEMGHYCAALKAGHKVSHGGFAIVILFPSLFVRTEDYLMVQRRRDRLFIALGGIYFDSMVFSGAVLTWFLAEPFSAVGQVGYVISFFTLVRMLVNLVPFFKMDGTRAFEELVGIRQVRMESIAVIRGLCAGRLYKPRHAGWTAGMLLALYGVADLAFMLLTAVMARFYVSSNAVALNLPYAELLGLAFGMLIALSFALGVRRDMRRHAVLKAALGPDDR